MHYGAIHRIAAWARGADRMLFYLADYLTRFHTGFNVFSYLTFRAILSALTALAISFIVFVAPVNGAEEIPHPCNIGMATDLEAGKKIPVGGVSNLPDRFSSGIRNLQAAKSCPPISALRHAAHHERRDDHRRHRRVGFRPSPGILADTTVEQSERIPLHVRPRSE